MQVHNNQSYVISLSILRDQSFEIILQSEETDVHMETKSKAKYPFFTILVEQSLRKCLLLSVDILILFLFGIRRHIHWSTNRKVVYLPYAKIASLKTNLYCKFSVHQKIWGLQISVNNWRIAPMKIIHSFSLQKKKKTHTRTHAQDQSKTIMDMFD